MVTANELPARGWMKRLKSLHVMYVRLWLPVAVLMWTVELKGCVKKWREHFYLFCFSLCYPYPTFFYSSFWICSLFINFLKKILFKFCLPPFLTVCLSFPSPLTQIWGNQTNQAMTWLLFLSNLFFLIPSLLFYPSLPFSQLLPNSFILSLVFSLSKYSFLLQTLTL